MKWHARALSFLMGLLVFAMRVMNVSSVVAGLQASVSVSSVQCALDSRACSLPVILFSTEKSAAHDLKVKA